MNNVSVSWWCQNNCLKKVEKMFLNFDSFKVKIIYTKKFLHSDWLRAVHKRVNSVQKEERNQAFWLVNDQRNSQITNQILDSVIRVHFYCLNIPGARAILLVFEKFTRAYLFQIARQIMWLPIQISFCQLKPVLHVSQQGILCLLWIRIGCNCLIQFKV